jgi:hypothetical protein
VARSKGRLPQQDAPGPRWRRESLAEFLKEGTAVPTGAPSAAPAPRSGTPASPVTPVSSAARTAAPVTSSVPSRPFPGEDAEDRRRRSMTVADVLACPHPAEDRKVTGYATICVVCGRRQSGRDSWAGAGYAGWDSSKLAACPHPDAERISRPWGQSCGVCGKPIR